MSRETDVMPRILLDPALFVSLYDEPISELQAHVIPGAGPLDLTLYLPGRYVLVGAQGMDAELTGVITDTDPVSLVITVVV